MIDRPFLYLYFNPVNVQEVVVFHIQVVRSRLSLAGNVVSNNLKDVHAFFQVKELVVVDGDVRGYALMDRNPGARSAVIDRPAEDCGAGLRAPKLLY
jgi:hypothetical protein